MANTDKSFSVNGRAYEIVDHRFDVVVVGAGGAGGTTVHAKVRPSARPCSSK